MFDKATELNADIHELIAKRWSGVAFDRERQVDPAALERLVEAARWAPSCFNEQPARLLVGNRHTHPECWQGIFDSLVEKNQQWCEAVPVLMAVIGKRIFTHNNAANPWFEYDCGAAALSACLQARHDGLMTHQMAGFNPEQLRQIFAIPEDYKAVAIMAIGYQLAEAEIPESLASRELAPRQRKPSRELASLGSTEGLW